MQYLIEIALFVFFIYLASNENTQLSYLSNTRLGKLVIISLIVLLSSYNMTYGVMGMLIYIILTHKNLEFMDTMSKSKHDDSDNDNDNDKKHEDEKDEKEDEDFPAPISTSEEQLTVDEKLRPKESNSLPVLKN